MKTFNVSIGNKMCQLTINMFEDELDVEEILKIDYANLTAELLTFPVIVNRLGLLLSDMDNKIAERKLSLEIYEAKQREVLRRKLTEEVEVNKKGDTKTVKPTKEELESALVLLPGYKIEKNLLFKAIKERDYINSIYWSASDKSRKLDKLSISIQPGDIDESLIAKSINGIEIRFANKRIE